MFLDWERFKQEDAEKKNEKKSGKKGPETRGDPPGE